MSESLSSNTVVPVKPLILQNSHQWQQKSKSNMTVSGHYRAGEKTGKRIHILHGTGFSAMTMAAMASQLPTDSSIWITDVPGHGLSTQPTTRMPSWQKMADTVADAIYQQANVKMNGPLIGIGHSMGAILTLLAAAKYPDLFSEIILLDPVLFKNEMIIAQQLMRATGIWRHRELVKSVGNRTAKWSSLEVMKSEIARKSFYRPWHEQVINDYCQYSTTLNRDNSVELSCSPKWEASIFGSYPKGLWQAVRKISLPVNILVANKTYFFIPNAVKRAAKINKNIQWQKFGNHHCFPMEQPIETAAVLEKIIARTQ
jgi:pimeloyl-ACP methyl ester carboxylesterase